MDLNNTEVTGTASRCNKSIPTAQIGYQDFFVEVMRHWEGLPMEVTDIPSLGLIKRGADVASGDSLMVRLGRSFGCLDLKVFSNPR